MKKGTVLILVLCLLLMTAAGCSSSRTGYTQDDYTHNSVKIGDYTCTEMKDGTLTIQHYGGEEEEVVIPEKLNGKKVVGLRLDSFSFRHVTKVTIPNSVVFCDGNPFNGYELETIEIDAGHPTLEVRDGVLFDKKEKKLICYFAHTDETSYEIPAGTKIIGTCAFTYSGELETVIIPDSVTQIDYYAFKQSGLKTVDIPRGVTRIEPMLFYKSRSLERVTIPDTVTFIGLQAFYDCTSLGGIVIPDSVTTVGEEAFYGCIMTNVVIPKSVTSIGEKAFVGRDPMLIVYHGTAGEKYCLESGNRHYTYAD